MLSVETKILNAVDKSWKSSKRLQIITLYGQNKYFMRSGFIRDAKRYPIFVSLSQPNLFRFDLLFFILLRHYVNSSDKFHYRPINFVSN